MLAKGALEFANIKDIRFALQELNQSMKSVIIFPFLSFLDNEMSHVNVIPPPQKKFYIAT